MANHLNESFQTKDESMEQYLKCSKQIITKFKAVKVEQILRAEKFQVDILPRMAATSNINMPRSVPVESKLFQASSKEKKVMCIETEKSWMDPIISYI